MREWGVPPREGGALRRQGLPVAPASISLQGLKDLCRVPQELRTQPGRKLGSGTPRLVSWRHSQALGHQDAACPRGPPTSESAGPERPNRAARAAGTAAEPGGPDGNTPGLGSRSADVFPASSGPGRAPEILMEPGPCGSVNAPAVSTCSSDGEHLFYCNLHLTLKLHLLFKENRNTHL